MHYILKEGEFYILPRCDGSACHVDPLFRLGGGSKPNMVMKFPLLIFSLYGPIVKTLEYFDQEIAAVLSSTNVLGVYQQP